MSATRSNNHTVVAMRRTKPSRNGNPNWDIALSNGEIYTTANDQNCAYALSPTLIGAAVTLILNSRSKITAIYRHTEMGLEYVA
jgi:hypothetical protein